MALPEAVPPAVRAAALAALRDGQWPGEVLDLLLDSAVDHSVNNGLAWRGLEAPGRQLVFGPEPEVSITVTPSDSGLVLHINARHEEQLAVELVSPGGAVGLDFGVGPVLLHSVPSGPVAFVLSRPTGPGRSVPLCRTSWVLL